MFNLKLTSFLTLVGLTQYSIAVNTFQAIEYSGFGNSQAYQQKSYNGVDTETVSVSSQRFNDMIAANAQLANPLPVYYYTPENEFCQKFSCAIYHTDKELVEQSGTPFTATAKVYCDADYDQSQCPMAGVTNGHDESVSESVSVGLGFDFFIQVQASGQIGWSQSVSTSLSESTPGIPGEYVCLMAVPVTLTGTFNCGLNGFTDTNQGVQSYWYCDAKEQNIVTAPKGDASGVNAFTYYPDTVSNGGCQ